ncbi:hypothetical protein BDP27DRAFT_1336908, partial [Rhodocollybia butyracea]
MRLTTFLTLLPLLVSISISIVHCKQVHVDVIAVGMNGQPNSINWGEKKDTPSYIVQSFRQVIFRQLGLGDPAEDDKAEDGQGKFRVNYNGFGQTKEKYVYFQVVVSKEVNGPANAPCRDGGGECFGFISTCTGSATEAYVGLFELPPVNGKEPQPKLELPDGSKCPLKLVGFREKMTDFQGEMQAPGEWINLAQQMWREFWPFKTAFSEVNPLPDPHPPSTTVDPTKQIEALGAMYERQIELLQQSSAYHNMMKAKMLKAKEMASGTQPLLRVPGGEKNQGKPDRKLTRGMLLRTSPSEADSTGRAC